MANAKTTLPLQELVTALDAGTNKALRRAARRIAVRGADIMRNEVPRRSGRLRESVKASVSRANPPEVTILASAVKQRSLGTATVVSPTGKTRRVTLRGGGSFNYARAVAEGTGLFGPKGQLIRPKRGRSLLIEVSSPPADESYLVFGGRYYIFRRTSKGQQPNDYIGRTVVKLEPIAARIVEEELAKL